MTEPTPTPAAAKPVWKRWYAIVAYVIVGLVLIFAFASIGGGDEDVMAEPSTAAAPENEPEPAPDDQCEQVEPALVEQIGSKLTSGAKATDQAAAVKSSDFDDVWMVAVTIDVDGSEQTGVWAVGGSLTAGESSGIYAVDGMAQEFSEWGTSAGDVAFDASLDGVDQAKGCL